MLKARIGVEDFRRATPHEYKNFVFCLKGLTSSSRRPLSCVFACFFKRAADLMEQLAPRRQC
jgi:hypothetical protein